MGTSTREKVCLRLEWEERGRGKPVRGTEWKLERKGLMEVRTEKDKGW